MFEVWFKSKTRPRIQAQEELKFLEAWLETPCLYEVNTEVALMNGEDIIAGAQMVETIHSEKENSLI